MYSRSLGVLGVLLGLTCLCFFCPGGTVLADTEVPPASSFSDLNERIALGMKITVIDGSGQKLHGTVTAMNESALEIQDGAKSFTFTEETLVEVRQRRQDSLLNGALIGAAAGAVPSIAVLASGVCDDEDCGGAFAAATAVYVAAGAGIGILIDSAIKKDMVIYRRVQMSLKFDTLTRTHSPGVALSIRW